MKEKKDLQEKVKDVLAIESFIKEVRRFKPRQALKLQRKLKVKLNNLTYFIPDVENSSKWNKIKLQIFTYTKQLERIKRIARKHEDSDSILANIIDSGINEISFEASILDIESDDDGNDQLDHLSLTHKEFEQIMAISDATRTSTSTKLPDIGDVDDMQQQLVREEIPSEKSTDDNSSVSTSTNPQLVTNDGEQQSLVREQTTPEKASDNSSALKENMTELLVLKEVKTTLPKFDDLILGGNSDVDDELEESNMLDMKSDDDDEPEFYDLILDMKTDDEMDDEAAKLLLNIEEHDTGYKDMNKINWQKETITVDFEPRRGSISYAVPDDMSEAELSFFIEKATCDPPTFKGFKFASRPENLQIATVTKLIHRRYHLLNKFHLERKEKRGNDKTLKDLLELHKKIDEKLWEQYRILGGKLKLEAREKPLEELMTGVEAKNACTMPKKFAIQGNVKSLCRLVMEENQFPSETEMLMVFLQHILIYGDFFEKVGIAIAFYHDNVKFKGSISNFALYCKRYDTKNKNYNVIGSKSLMFVGKHRFMSTLESSGILIAGTIGIRGNHKQDKGLSFNPQLASFDALGVLYSNKIKIADPYEVFLDKAIPASVPDALSIIVFHALRRLQIKSVWPCYVCKKLITTRTKTHLEGHMRGKRVIPEQSKFEDFSCYEEFIIVVMSMVKKSYAIDDLFSYIIRLDKWYNEIYGITALFGSLGCHMLKDNASSFQESDGEGNYNSETNIMMTASSHNLLRIKSDANVKSIEKFMKSFLLSKEFHDSFKFLWSNDVKINA